MVTQLRDNSTRLIGLGRKCLGLSMLACLVLALGHNMRIRPNDAPQTACESSVEADEGGEIAEFTPATPLNLPLVSALISASIRWHAPDEVCPGVAGQAYDDTGSPRAPPFHSILS